MKLTSTLFNLKIKKSTLFLINLIKHYQYQQIKKRTAV